MTLGIRRTRQEEFRRLYNLDVLPRLLNDTDNEWKSEYITLYVNYASDRMLLNFKDQAKNIFTTKYGNFMLKLRPLSFKNTYGIFNLISTSILRKKMFFWRINV